MTLETELETNVYLEICRVAGLPPDASEGKRIAEIVRDDRWEELDTPARRQVLARQESIKALVETIPTSPPPAQ